MTPALASAFNQQANRELATSHLFRALSYWADVRDYSGFKELFDRQAEEEETHAKQFYAFLVDHDVTPAIGPFTVVAPSYKELGVVAQAIHEHEIENTHSIHALYEQAIAEKSYGTQVFLQPFVLEQVEEESWTASLVERVNRSSCPGALYNLDRHIVKDLFGDK